MILTITRFHAACRVPHRVFLHTECLLILSAIRRGHLARNAIAKITVLSLGFKLPLIAHCEMSGTR